MLLVEMDPENSSSQDGINKHIASIELSTPEKLFAHAKTIPAIARLPGASPSRYRARSIISIIAGLAWMIFSILISQQWWGDLRTTFGDIFGTLIIVGIAWIPGYLYAQLFASVLLDRRPKLPLSDIEQLPPLTVIIAVYNEEETINITIEHLLKSSYPGELRIYIVDDGSTDETLARSAVLANEHSNLKIMSAPHGGKHSALNAALLHVDTPLVMTVDADTLVEPEALCRIVSRMLTTENCVAVAGSLLVDNDNETLISRMQSWEYRLSIAAIKRQQALFGATLVAQGAFSVYSTREVTTLGGWPDAIGEDILLTWALIDSTGQVEFEPTAFARTQVPVTMKQLYRQRRRWAQGMIEGLRSHGPSMIGSHRLSAHGVMINYLLPLIDIMYLFVFVPGFLAAVFFEYYAIVGPITFLVLPMAIALFATMGYFGRKARKEAGIVIDRQWSGMIAYMTFYRTLISAAAIAGYLRELRGRERDW